MVGFALAGLLFILTPFLQLMQANDAADAILGAVPEAEAGVGMALTRPLQFIAMSLGVAILGSILNSAYRSGLGG